MKKLRYYLVLLLLPCVLSVLAQTKEEIAGRFLVNKTEELGLIPGDLAELRLSGHYLSKKSGVENFYYQQMRKGIDVRGAIFNVHITQDNKVLTFGSRFIPHLAGKIKAEKVVLSPAAAVEAAAAHLGYALTQPLELLAGNGGPAQEAIFAGGSLSAEDVTVKLVYQPLPGGAVKLAWDLAIYEPSFQNWWSVRIDAATGQLLGKNNLVIHCNWGEAPIPAPPPDVPGVPLAVASPLAALVANYNVFAAPVESPNHGSRSLLSDPSNATASPYGWHDTNGSAGAEYTITRGNNVYAQLDDDGNNSTFGYSPDGGSGLNFDFSLDLSLPPASNLDPIITNMFYWNNILHDISYQYGFDEVGGNFQENNYGKGGTGTDDLIADAQDAGGTNNANMSTPVDGNSPRMQMYIWSSSNSDNVTVNSPPGIAGLYSVGTAAFGPQIFEVTNDLVLVDDGVGNTSDGCETPFVNSVSGKIALIDRSTCDYSEQAYNAQTEGAVGVIICNNAGGSAPAMPSGNNAGLVTIPVLSLSLANCNTIKANMPVKATLLRAQDRDSDLDNGVIAHEYAHGISNRLTGGPSATWCLGGDEQMGEGWSDWIALMLTLESGDQGTDSRGIGTYLLFEPVTGDGIRTYPYSTDMSVNPHTYDDIKTLSVPHGVGSVWCAMLWELTWKLIAQYGFSTNIYSGTAGNNKALQLVMEGMKLQPCNPGFVDGRAAILSADQVLFSGANQCLIWEAFAKRGLGYSASQGNSDSRSDGTEAFDLPPSCKLSMTKAASVSMAAPGDNIQYTLTVENLTAGNVSSILITDDVPANTTYVTGSASNGGSESGGTVSFPSFTLASGQNAVRTFSVQVDAGAPTSIYTFSDGMENGSANWSTMSTNTASTTWVVNGANTHGGSNAWFADDVAAPNEQYLYTANEVLLNATSQLTFWHNYNTELHWDGGRVHISTDNGVSWTDLGPGMTVNGYNDEVDNSGIAAFSGNSGGYIQTTVDLSSYAGDYAIFRFWMHSDIYVGAVGWYIDDVAITQLTPAIPNTAAVSFQAGGSFSNSASLADPTQLTVALPVELLSFSGQPMEYTNLLEWAAASEQNVARFVVERSPGNGQWEEAGWLVATGFSSVIKHYSLEDKNPPLSAYYRLRSEDFDGSESLSPVILIERTANGLGQLRLFPNPASQALTVELLAGDNSTLTYRLENVLGVALKEGSFDSRKGFNQWQIEMDNLPGGVYWFTLSDGEKRTTRKVLKE
jgi:extracellular elastinolytic metalloproteinase